MSLESGTNIRRGLSLDIKSQRLIALVDTNAINDLADGKLNLSEFSAFCPFITTIQYDELAQTPDESRRRLLLDVMKTKRLDLIHTGVFISGYSRLKLSKMGMGAYYGLVLQGLEACQTPSVVRHKRKSNIHDAILAETAIVEGMMLVSNDADLRRLVIKFGGHAIDLRSANKD